MRSYWIRGALNPLSGIPINKGHTETRTEKKATSDSGRGERVAAPRQRPPQTAGHHQKPGDCHGKSVPQPLEATSPANTLILDFWPHEL